MRDGPCPCRHMTSCLVVQHVAAEPLGHRHRARAGRESAPTCAAPSPVTPSRRTSPATMASSSWADRCRPARTRGSRADGPRWPSCGTPSLVACRRWASASGRSCWRWPPAAGPTPVPTGPRSGGPRVDLLAAHDGDDRFSPGSRPACRCCTGTATPSICRRGLGTWRANGRYPNQAFGVGPAAWGLQFHLEVTTDAVDGFLRAFPADAAPCPGRSAAADRNDATSSRSSPGPWRDLAFDRFAALVAAGATRRHRWISPRFRRYF